MGHLPPARCPPGALRVTWLKQRQGPDHRELYTEAASSHGEWGGRVISAAEFQYEGWW